jgi:Uma2 family endonuclease
MATTVAKPARATVEALYRAPGKAELVNGKLVLMPPTGAQPGYAADEIFASLRTYAKRTQSGRAVADNKGFLVNLPHRESFSPDAAFWMGDDPGMKFYVGAPIFAVEVRCENDYGAAAEKALAAKRADYFAAGTQAVWDVDVLAEPVVRLYLAIAPDEPTVFCSGERAHAEPVLPGWSMAVDDLIARS